MLLLEFCGMGSSESGSYSSYVEIVLRKSGQAFDWLFRDAANNDRHSRKLFIETYTFCSDKTFAMDFQLTPLQNNVAVCCCMILYFKLAIEVSVKIPLIFWLSIFFWVHSTIFSFFFLSLRVSISMFYRSNEYQFACWMRLRFQRNIARPVLHMLFTSTVIFWWVWCVSGSLHIVGCSTHTVQPLPNVLGLISIHQNGVGD